MLNLCLGKASSLNTCREWDARHHDLNTIKQILNISKDFFILDYSMQTNKGSGEPYIAQAVLVQIIKSSC